MAVGGCGGGACAVRRGVWRGRAVGGEEHQAARRWGGAPVRSRAGVPARRRGPHSNHAFNRFSSHGHRFGTVRAAADNARQRYAAVQDATSAESYDAHVRQLQRTRRVEVDMAILLAMMMSSYVPPTRERVIRRRSVRAVWQRSWYTRGVR